MKSIFVVLGLLVVLVAVMHSAEARCPRRICTREYKPVCAKDGLARRTYANKCLYERARCLNPKLRLLREGPCKK